jgi:hypothetical protein
MHASSLQAIKPDPGEQEMAGYQLHTVMTVSKTAVPPADGQVEACAVPVYGALNAYQTSAPMLQPVRPLDVVAPTLLPEKVDGSTTEVALVHTSFTCAEEWPVMIARIPATMLARICVDVMDLSSCKHFRSPSSSPLRPS